MNDSSDFKLVSLFSHRAREVNKPVDKDWMYIIMAAILNNNETFNYLIIYNLIIVVCMKT